MHPRRLLTTWTCETGRQRGGIVFCLFVLGASWTHLFRAFRGRKQHHWQPLDLVVERAALYAREAC